MPKSKQKNVSDPLFLRALKGDLWSRRTNRLVAIALGLLILGIGYIIVVTYAQQPGSTLSGPVISAHPSKCMDNNSGFLQNGNKIQVWDCNNTGSQQWIFQKDGTVHLTSTAWCLDVENGNNGADMKLNSCNSTSSQVWHATDDHTVVQQITGRCMEIAGDNATNGTVLKASTCNGSDAQKWYFNTPLDSAYAGKCLDKAGGVADPNNVVHLWDCNNTLAQKWTFKHGGTVNLNGSAMCLDVENGSKDLGTPLRIKACNGSVSQVWQFKAETHELINTNSGLCVDDKHSLTGNGNPVWLWGCNGTNAQKWFAPTSTGAPVTVPTTPTPTPPTPTPTPPATPPTPTPPTNPPAPTGATWADEFNGNELSYATDNGGGNWRTKGYEAGGSVNNGYNDFVAKNWNASAPQAKQYGLATVGNGILSLKAKRSNTLPGINAEGAQWTGVYLVSNHLNNLTWRYGYFEWRMRDPNPVRGMFPTLWMFNNVPDRHNGYEGAELDMIEIFGSRTGSPWYSGIHFEPGALNGSKGHNVATTYSDTANWHRYSIEWTADKITYARDGNVLGTIAGAEAAWYRNANLGLRMNYAMDPDWNVGGEFQSTGNDPAPGTEPRMEVDYVRYYAQKPGNLPGGTEDPYK